MIVSLQKDVLFLKGLMQKWKTTTRDPSLEFFSFKQQGASVAVAFDDNVYIGQVMDIKSNNMATVKFLRQIKGAEQSGAFKWPQIDDMSDVDSKFIVDMNFTILPCGRTVKIPGYDQILEKFQLYPELYMD